MQQLIRSFVMRRRWWYALIAFYAVAVGVSLGESLGNIRHHSQEVAAEGARNVVRMVVLMRQWNASHGGVYVPVSAAAPPNPHLKLDHRDVTTTDGQRLTLVNPAYMTRMTSDLAVSQGGVTFRATSLNPVRAANGPDAWERGALDRLATGAKEVTEATLSAQGEPLFRYMSPLYVVKECLKCHSEQGYKEGDIRGGISVTQPLAPFLMAAAPSERLSIMAHLAVFVLLAGSGWWWLEQLSRRWLELEDKIEELERTRHELLQSEKMASLGRMVAGFAHEINTPIGVAVGAISHGDETLNGIDALLAQEEVNEQDLRDQLESLRQGGKLAYANLRRAANLVQRFKRSAVDQASEEHRVFDMKTVLEDVVFSLQGELKRTAVSIATACPEELAVYGIPGLIEQLITNLVMNSLQHGFDNGTRAGNIRIVVTLSPIDELLIDYDDDGQGMAAEAVDRIFEPFFTTRRGAGGTGLGMYLCYTIVTTQLRGTIRCTSAPDRGAHFAIAFPYTAPSGTATEQVG